MFLYYSDGWVFKDVQFFGNKYEKIHLHKDIKAYNSWIATTPNKLWTKPFNYLRLSGGWATHTRLIKDSCESTTWKQALLALRFIYSFFLSFFTNITLKGEGKFFKEMNSASKLLLAKEWIWKVSIQLKSLSN